LRLLLEERGSSPTPAGVDAATERVLRQNIVFAPRTALRRFAVVRRKRERCRPDLRSGLDGEGPVKPAAPAAWYTELEDKTGLELGRDP